MITVFGTRKGGAGKSTITTNIAALRKIRGHDVCLVDCDDQRSATRWNEMRTEFGIEPDVPMINAVGKRVGETISAQASRYEDLVVDVPGRDTDELRLGALVCDVFALPLKLSMMDMWALELDLAMINEIQLQRTQIGRPFRPFIFFNEVSTLPNVRDKQLDTMAKELLKFKEQLIDGKIAVCPVHLSDREAYKKVIGEGKSIFELGSENISDVKAQEEIIGLYDYIYGDDHVQQK